MIRYQYNLLPTRKYDFYCLQNIICCLKQTHFTCKGKQRLKIKTWKKIFHANGNQKSAGVAILISDKIDFKKKTMRRDKEGHHIMIKWSVQQEDTTILNEHVPNTGALRYIKQILLELEREIGPNTVTVGDFNTTISAVDWFSRQKINKETPDLICTIEQIDIIDVYRTFFHF